MGLRGLQTAAVITTAMSGRCSSSRWASLASGSSPEDACAAGPLSKSGAVLLPCDLTMDQLRHVSLEAAVMYFM